MHPKTWEAIIVAASILYEKREMDGEEVERIFESLRAPQVDCAAMPACRCCSANLATVFKCVFSDSRTAGPRK